MDLLTFSLNLACQHNNYIKDGRFPMQCRLAASPVFGHYFQPPIAKSNSSKLEFHNCWMVVLAPFVAAAISQNLQNSYRRISLGPNPAARQRKQ